MDGLGRILTWNPAAEKMFGYNREQAIGLAFSDLLVSPEDMSSYQKAENYAATERDSPGPAFTVELKARRRHAEEFPVSVTLASRKQWAGWLPTTTTTTTTLVIRDITERKNIEEALEDYRKHLEEMVSERTAELERVNNALTKEMAIRQQAEADMRALSDRLISVQETERHSIARELHDNTGASLSLVALMIDKSLQSAPDRVPSLLKEARAQVSKVITHVRNLSLELRPGMLDNLGLLAALEWLIDHYSSKGGSEINFAPENMDSPFSPEVSTAAYRIVQEALTNIIRYAGKCDVIIKARVESGALYLSVEDNGSGFDMSKLTAFTSTGLSGMRERCRLLGGGLRVESTPSKGTRVMAELPLSSASKDKPTS